MEQVFIFIWMAISVVLFLYWIYTIIEILKNEYTGSNKIIWLAIVFFFFIVGVILYKYIGKSQKIEKKVN